MSRRPIAHILAAALIAMSGIAAMAALAAERTPPAAPLTPVQVIRARQASYELSVMTFSQLKRAADTGSDVTKQKFAADALAGWAAVLPSLFPAGTGPGQTSVETHALAEVWSNRSGFLARANEFSVATSRLVDLARSGDTSGFASQLAVVKKACDSCHADFQDARLTVDKKGARRIIVWDLPVRLIHWSIVVLVPLAWWSFEVDQMALHRAAGYGVLALVAVRIVWGFFGSTTARFAYFLRGPRRVADYLAGRAPNYVGHNPLGGWSVALLLSVLLVQPLLGLFAADAEGLDSGPLSGLISDDHAQSAEHWHAIFFYVLLALVALHVAAILFYAFRGKNLVWPMLSGRAQLATDVKAPRLAHEFGAGAILLLGILLFVSLWWWGG